jgi:hypothetical protein
MTEDCPFCWEIPIHEVLEAGRDRSAGLFVVLRESLRRSPSTDHRSTAHSSVLSVRLQANPAYIRRSCLTSGAATPGPVSTLPRRFTSAAPLPKAVIPPSVAISGAPPPTKLSEAVVRSNLPLPQMRSQLSLRPAQSDHSKSRPSCSELNGACGIH